MVTEALRVNVHARVAPQRTDAEVVVAAEPLIIGGRDRGRHRPDEVLPGVRPLRPNLTNWSVGQMFGEMGTATGDTRGRRRIERRHRMSSPCVARVILSRWT
jgi:hypothetical protein